MGVDLLLLPIDYESKQLSFSHTVLSCERDYMLFEEIQGLLISLSTPIPDNLTTFVGRREGVEDTCYGGTITDPYGDQIRCVSVKWLLQVTLEKIGRNKAIWAYLECLPPETKVALYWH